MGIAGFPVGLNAVWAGNQSVKVLQRLPEYCSIWHLRRDHFFIQRIRIDINIFKKLEIASHSRRDCRTAFTEVQANTLSKGKRGNVRFRFGK